MAPASASVAAWCKTQFIKDCLLSQERLMSELASFCSVREDTRMEISCLTEDINEVSEGVRKLKGDFG